MNTASAFGARRLLGACAIAVLVTAAHARQGSQSPQPGNNVAGWPPQEWPTSSWPAKDWPWPASLDPAVAAPRNYKLLWENDKLRLMEVTIRPGEKVPMHDDPYPSVLGFDSPFPPDAEVTDTPLVKGDPRNDALAARGSAPPDKQYPTCATSAPQAPHKIANRGESVIHYYRVDFRRVDGYGFQEHWKEWYPWMLVPPFLIKDLVPGPELGPPFSKDFPYPFAYDSVRASPKNHYVRYEDDHIRFIEVVGHPGGTENMHGHPYPSIFIYDTTATPAETKAAEAGIKLLSVDHKLYPNDPHNLLVGSYGNAPEKAPLACRTMDPQAPHQNTRHADFPIHFYRLEFKRIDGDQIKTNWKEW